MFKLHFYFLSSAITHLILIGQKLVKKNGEGVAWIIYLELGLAVNRSKAIVTSNNPERCGSSGMQSWLSGSQGQRLVNGARRVWAPMNICNKPWKLSPWTALRIVMQRLLLCFRKKVEGVSLQGTYYVLLTIHSFNNCLLSAYHNLAPSWTWFLSIKSSNYSIQFNFL